MAEFKPMVKMMTTEPSVVLKLKKGGHVDMKGGKGEHGHKKMADGGMMDSLDRASMGARPAMSMSPMARAMAARKKPMIAPPRMKEGGETKSMHKAEMSKMGKIEKELKSHEGKPASKAHKGLKTGGIAKSTKPGAYKTGGVVNGQGGFKDGGIIKSTKGETKMVYAKPDTNSAPTGDVKMGNAGGYKKGGAAKKHYATGGVVDSGRPVAMPQGAKKPSAPVAINQLAGTFKKGGTVTSTEKRLQKSFETENAPAMRAAKAMTEDVYSKYQTSKKRGGAVC